MDESIVDDSRISKSIETEHRLEVGRRCKNDRLKNMELPFQANDTCRDQMEVVVAEQCECGKHHGTVTYNG